MKKNNELFTDGLQKGKIPKVEWMNDWGYIWEIWLFIYIKKNSIISI